MAVTATILVEEDFTTSNLVGTFVHDNLKLRILHIYLDSTAKHSFYLIRKNQKTIRFVECWLGKERNAVWEFDLFELPADVFLFLLNMEEYFAQTALQRLEAYMTGSVESYASFDMYKHRKSVSVKEVIDFVEGDWWLPK